MSDIRLLTQEEIEDILSVIPEIPSAVPEISNYNRANLLESYASTLATIKLDPAAIPEFKNTLYNSFIKITTTPGYTAGLLAADSITAPLMQDTMNSFKATGAKMSEYGEKTANQTIGLSTRDPPILKVFFKTPVSEIDILQDKKPDLEAITIQDIKDRTEVDDPINILDLDSNGNIVEPWWYQYYRPLHNVNSVNFSLMEGSQMMRLHLDVNLMYTHKITSSKVIKTLLSGRNNENLMICIPSPILTRKERKYVIQTSEEGNRNVEVEVDVAYQFIDIFPRSDSNPDLLNFLTKTGIQAIDNMRSNYYWLTSILEPSFKKMQIKGIDGIEGVYLEKSLVKQIISNEEYLIIKSPQEFSDKAGVSWEQLPAYINSYYSKLVVVPTAPFPVPINNPNDWGQDIIIWKEYYENRRIKTTAIGPDKLATLFQICGLVILPYTQGELNMGANTSYLKVMGIYPRPDNFNALMEKEKEKRFISPLTWCGYKYQLEKEEDKDYTRRRQQEIKEAVSGLRDDIFNFSKRPIKNPKTSVILSYEINYAMIRGRNLREIFKRSDVDTNRCYSNDFFETFYIFGIEGLRNLILEELMGCSLNSGYISPQHLTLLADFMCHNGIPVKITYTGLRGEFEDFLKKKAFERPFEVMVETATTGVSEEIHSGAGSIFLGNEANVGSNFKDRFMKESFQKKLDAQIRDLSVLELEAQISSLGEMDFPPPPDPEGVNLLHKTLEPTVRIPYQERPRVYESGPGDDLSAEVLAPPIIINEPTKKIMMETLGDSVLIRDILPKKGGEGAIIIPPLEGEALFTAGEEEESLGELLTSENYALPHVIVNPDYNPELLSLLDEAETFDI